MLTDSANRVNPVGSSVRTREKTTMAQPEWRRVAAEIRQRIRDGRDLRVDDQGRRWLPPYDPLQKQHGTSYGTLRQVLLVLEAERWIIRRPGVGLMVHPDHPA